MLTLQKQFERHLQGSRFFSTHDKVVVAVSTGVDSMVLLDLLQQLPPALRPQLVVAHMNHELREQSVEEEAYIREYCQNRQLPLVVRHWPRKEHPQTGVENAARQVRYRFFADVMAKTGANILATAHHENDLAETMLMKMTRGGQLPQLLGIRDQRSFASGKLVRPLLPFNKQQLISYAQTRQIKWYEDATNAELDVQRNRFRHEVIPLLERENGQLLDHLASYHQQLANLLAWQDEELTRRMHQVIDGHQHLQIAALQKNSALTQRLLLEKWLNCNRVFDVKEGQLADLLQLIANDQRPQQTVELPHGKLFCKEYTYCRLKDGNKLPEKLQKVQPHVIELEQWYNVDDTRQLAVATSEQFFEGQGQWMRMWLAPTQLPLRLREWRTGDRLLLKGGGHQQVKRVLIDQKVPAAARKRQLVVVDAEGEVVWLIDRKWSWFTRPEDYRQRWQPVVIGIKDKEENEHG